MRSLAPEQSFARYESIRTRLPSAEFSGTLQRISDLGEISDRFDVFVFDSYGVLNVGPEPIKGARQRLESLRAMDKHLFILTNAAHSPLRANVERYRGLGFEFSDQEIVSSREALAIEMASRTGMVWAVMAFEEADIAELPGTCIPLEGDAFQIADGFILLSSFTWTDQDQAALCHALAEQPRPVLVGNPDLVAPTPDGHLVQPGYYANEFADLTGIEPEFYGKPFSNAFDIVKGRLPSDTRPDRVLMIGDTLHTDVLGGAAAGFKTALAVQHSVLTGLDIDRCVSESAIIPDYILPTI